MLECWAAEHAVGGELFALLRLDTEDFKLIDDTCGHPVEGRVFVQV